MEFVGIGDLHFDGTLSRYLPDLNERIVAEARKPLEYARQKGIRNAFFYGDIAHTPTLSQSGQRAFLKLLTEYSDLRLVVIAGNHDKQATGGTLAENPSIALFSDMVDVGMLDHVKMIVHKPRTVKMNGVRVKFSPWPHCNLDPTALNVIHTELQGCQLDNGRAYTGTDSPDPKSVAVVAGHIHTPHQFKNTYYAGTLYQTNFGESQKKGWHHGRYKGKKLSCKLIPNKPNFLLHNVIVKTLADLDDVPKGATNLVKLFVHRGVAVPARFLTDYPNVVKTNSFKTDEDLKVLVQDELRIDGVELQVDEAQFFRNWLKQQTTPVKVKKRALTLYKELKGVE